MPVHALFRQFRRISSLIASVCIACTSPAPPTARTVDTNTAATTDTDLQTYDLRALEADVQKLPHGPERDYFAGMLAARAGRFDDAIAQLNRALPRLRDSSPKRTATALEAIATAYRAEDRYNEAAKAYAELADKYSSQLDRFPEDDAALARILKDATPQAIAWHGPVALKTTKNPIGSRSTALIVNGVRGSWMLDTGANQSLVSRTFAQRLGVTLLPGEAAVGSGLTGLKSRLRVGQLKELSLGGATLTSVVLLVLDDENLKFGSGPDAYQLDAVLGYPVFKALGVVAFTRDTFLAGENAAATGPSVPMYMRGLTPVVAADVDRRSLLFTLDTGASSSDLSVRYYDLFRANASSWKKRTLESAGGGGSVTREFFVQPQLTMKVGATTVTLPDVTITPTRMDGGLDVLFGNLGQDFFERFERFSLDFSAMTFTTGALVGGEGVRP